jgi:hypothetical protein
MENHENDKRLSNIFKSLLIKINATVYADFSQSFQSLSERDAILDFELQRKKGE